jgi:hypothetical protein
MNASATSWALFRDGSSQPDCLGYIRNDSARLGSGAGDLRLRAGPHPFRLHAGPGDTHGFRSFPRACRVCRDFAHLAVTFCRCLNVPGRYVNDWATSVYRSSIQWISASGSRFSSRVRGIHSMRATTFQELAGSSSRVGATPPTSLSSIHSDLMS